MGNVDRTVSGMGHTVWVVLFNLWILSMGAELRDNKCTVHQSNAITSFSRQVYSGTHLPRYSRSRTRETHKPIDVQLLRVFFHRVYWHRPWMLHVKHGAPEVEMTWYLYYKASRTLVLQELASPRPTSTSSPPSHQDT